MVSMAALLAIAMPIAFGRAHPKMIVLPPQSNYKFEVASVKIEKSPAFGNGLPKILVDPAPDGFTASGVNLVQLISYAYAGGRLRRR